MKFFEKLILVEKRRRKAQEMSDDEIEKDQEEDERDEIDTATKASARSGQAVEMSEPGQVNASKKSKKKDDKWIQKAVNPDHEGYCTPMTKDTCTPRRKALAKTFKKMGKERDRKIKAKDEK